jgi:uncharacterized protein (DUF488 family)
MALAYTIGYEGTDIERFIDTLKAVGITVLADVRAVALSRKKGFSKTALKTRLAQEGITYLHFAELGDPKPGREAARAGRYAEFRRIYSKHLAGERAQDAFGSLLHTVKSKTACLMCFERDPTHCHRSIVAQKLKVSGTDIFDLYAEHPSRYANHAAQLSRHYPRQGAATA